MSNLDKLAEGARKANDAAEPWADRVVAHVLNSRWTVVYLIAFAVVTFMAGRLSK